MNFDVLFIGSGPAGYVGALQAAKLGLKVAVAEKCDLGGTCLNVGCIPSKALLHATEVIYAAKHEGPNFGYDVSGQLDFAKLMQFKDKAIYKFQKGIEHLFKKNGITLLKGQARFTSSKQVEVSGQRIDTKNIVIACGSKPVNLPFLEFDEKLVLSSTGALNLQSQPKSMAVIGGGVIGLELGSVFARIGTEVTVLEAQNRLLPEFDQQISKTFNTIMKRQGLECHLSSFVKSAQVNQDSVTLQFEKGGQMQSLEVQRVLVAIGRAPSTESLNLNAAGIVTDTKGFIVIDEAFQTSSANIYAVGDCAANPLLAHKGSHEGVILAKALAGQNEKLNYAAIPNVVYTAPEVASVGFTEQELKQKQISFKSKSFPIQANSRYGAIAGSDPGFVKILMSSDEKKLLGMHIISPAAGEMIMEGVIAITNNLPISSIEHAIHAHPTFSESIHEALTNLHI